MIDAKGSSDDSNLGASGREQKGIPSCSVSATVPQKRLTTMGPRWVDFYIVPKICLVGGRWSPALFFKRTACDPILEAWTLGWLSHLVGTSEVRQAGRQSGRERWRGYLDEAEHPDQAWQGQCVLLAFEKPS